MGDANGTGIRVVIADDHPIYREGMKRALSEGPFSVVAEAGTCAETLDCLRNIEADVLLMDLRMPRDGGLTLLKDVKKEWPDLPVLVVSVEPEDMFALRAIRAGAAGFLQKDDADTATVQGAVSKVAGGGRYITPKTAARLADFVTAPNVEKPERESLSDREMQVLRMIGTGMSVSEVADQLSLSVKTVSTYRSRILEKTGMSNTAQLIRYAIEQELV